LVFLFYFFFSAASSTDLYTLSYTTLFRSKDLMTGSSRSGAAFDADGLSSSTSISIVIAEPRTSRASSSSAARASRTASAVNASRSEEHTSELQSLRQLVCRLLLEKKKTHT